MNIADLHIHTLESDGCYSIKEVVDLAVKSKLKAISITNHNTLSGLQKAIEYGKTKGLKVIPGIEIDCIEPNNKFLQIHILGLFIDHKDSNFQDFVKTLEVKKTNYLFEAFKKKLKRATRNNHKIRILFRKSGNLVRKIKLKKQLRKKPTIKKVIKEIKLAKGVPVLAHPGLLPEKQQLKVITRFKKYGGKGIEISYPYNEIYGFSNKKVKKIIKRFKKIAKQEQLFITGGSDFHGDQQINIGDYGLSLSELINLIKK